MRPIALLFGLLVLAPAARAASPPAPPPGSQGLDAQLQQMPLQQKLATWLRLIQPGQGSAQELADFRARNPDWPRQGSLAFAYDQALVAEPDDQAAAPLCLESTPVSARALARCAAALQASDPARAQGFARSAWAAGIEDPAFLAAWQASLPESASWDRFRHEAAHNDFAGASATLPFLNATHQAAANAWLALAQAPPNAIEPGALAAWTSQSGQAAAVGGAAIWPMEERLARGFLAQNDPHDAYTAINAAAFPADSAAAGQTADRDFLAGFIALRYLHDPASARRWFTALAASSRAVITQGRAWYWRARTEDGAAAAADYARAATFPTTFYGQLAALALGDDPAALAARIRKAASSGPVITPGMALRFADTELAEAAVQLAQTGDTKDAASFLTRLGQIEPDDAGRVLAARLALALNIPWSAVATGRLAGVEGQALLPEGWPLAVSPPQGGIPPAVLFGIMRQESSFDPNALSPSNAQGLMQLLPGTARDTARKFGLPLPASLTADPQANMALGAAYLGELLNDFGNCLPLAIAGYNAGPNNVSAWISANGDPELPDTDIIDWLERIPFSETRNYVQRVTEGIVIYEALEGQPAADPVSPWLHRK